MAQHTELGFRNRVAEIMDDYPPEYQEEPPVAAQHPAPQRRMIIQRVLGPVVFVLIILVIAMALALLIATKTPDSTPRVDNEPGIQASQ